METRQLNFFGGEDTIRPITKGNRYRKMQEIHGKTEGKTCGTCANCVRCVVGKRSVFKCKGWIVTSSAATDIRLKDPACGMYWEECEDDERRKD